MKVAAQSVAHSDVFGIIADMGTGTLTRKSAPLDDEQLAVVEAIHVGGTPERAAFESLVGQARSKVSEAQAISTLVSLGIDRVREAVLDQQYAAYAAAMDDEDREYAETVRARRSHRALAGD